MIAKLISNNQIHLPESVLASFQGTEYFDVTSEGAASS